MRTILPFLMCCVLLSGCFKSDIDAKSNIDAKAEIQAQVDSFLKANLDSLIKAQVDTKVQGVGVDIKNKLADELNAQISQELQTKVDAILASTTQNSGMFSGGAIYIGIVFIAFFAMLFGTIIILAKKAAKWKKIWTLVSHSIEHQASKEKHVAFISDLKSHIATSLEVSGLKNHVDKNLQKRGLRKRK